jgi:hypothetical protein
MIQSSVCTAYSCPLVKEFPPALAIASSFLVRQARLILITSQLAFNLETATKFNPDTIASAELKLLILIHLLAILIILSITFTRFLISELEK